MDSSEQHRHRCEVRDLIAKAKRNGKDWIQVYCDGNGRDRRRWKRWAGSLLERDFWAQWKAGNTGAHGEWIDGKAHRMASDETKGLTP